MQIEGIGENPKRNKQNGEKGKAWQRNDNNEQKEWARNDTTSSQKKIPPPSSFVSKT